MNKCPKSSPKVLNTGTSKIVATLRVYQDPTYSIPASSIAALPIVVSRFFLEMSTKFTRNRISISDCTAAHLEHLLNDSASVRPRKNYCDNSTFDSQPERAPPGVTHLERLSMKKFKFQGTTDVFMQCKLRACAQQPCGICTGRRALGIDLTPVEGDMFAPPAQIRISPFDKNALVFAPVVPSQRNAFPYLQQLIPLGSSRNGKVGDDATIKTLFKADALSGPGAGGRLSGPLE